MLEFRSSLKFFRKDLPSQLVSAINMYTVYLHACAVHCEIYLGCVKCFSSRHILSFFLSGWLIFNISSVKVVYLNSVQCLRKSFEASAENRWQVVSGHCCIYTRAKTLTPLIMFVCERVRNCDVVKKKDYKMEGSILQIIQLLLKEYCISETWENRLVRSCWVTELEITLLLFKCLKCVQIQREPLMVLWVELCPPPLKIHVQVLTPVPIMWPDLEIGSLQT